MAEIHELDDYRPHMVVDCSNSVQILPVALIEKIASGTMSIAEIEDPESMAQALAVLAMGNISDN